MGDRSASWAALVLDVPEGLEDDLAGGLGADTLGVESKPASPGRAFLHLYVRDLPEARALRALAIERLAALGLSDERFDARVEAVEDERWVERYQAGLLPFPVGESFLIVPDGSAHARPGRVSIVLVPGRAFGTGEHATTRLCVEALEREVVAGSRWLDLGCGTGILAVAAALRGASLVHARDDDPEAIEVAREVVAANGVGARVRLGLGSGEELAGAGLDGVVANIAAPYFASHARQAAAPLRAGGTLLAAGLLADESDEIARALRDAGLSIVAQASREGWALLTARRDCPA